MLERQQRVASNVTKWLLHKRTKSGSVVGFSDMQTKRRIQSATMLTFLVVAPGVAWADYHTDDTTAPAKHLESAQHQVPKTQHQSTVTNGYEATTRMTTNDTPSPQSTPDHQSNSGTTVTVNGETTALAPNTSYQRTITDDSQTTTIDVTQQGTAVTSHTSTISSGTASNTNTVSVDMHTSDP